MSFQLKTPKIDHVQFLKIGSNDFGQITTSVFFTDQMYVSTYFKITASMVIGKKKDHFSTILIQFGSRASKNPNNTY